MTTVQAQASRDGQGWLVLVEEIGKHTWVRSLSDVEEMAADLAATWWGIDIAQVSAEVRIVIPEEVLAEVERAREFHDEAELARRNSTLASQRAVRELRARGWTMRDIGQALGISHQRVHQLSR